MARRGDTITFPFVPRPYQLASFKARANGYTRGICIWPRRHGKDLHGLTLLAGEALKRKGLYNYYWPTFSLAKKTVWKGMDREGTPFLDYLPKQLIKEKNETELRLELTNGSIIQLVGTDNINQNVVGINPVGCLFSEYPLQNPLAWELTRPILKENGGWAWFLYTPRGRNHGYRLYQTAKANPESWFLSHLTILDTTRADGTPVLTPKDVEDEIKEGMDPDLAQQEYYCHSFGTRVLTADCTWRPIETVAVGETLVGFDETRVAKTRALRRSVVESVQHVKARCLTFTLQSGQRVTVTRNHRWLTIDPRVHHDTYRWTAAHHIRIGDQLVQSGLRPWDRLETYDAGWLAGLADGEGCVSRRSVQIAQKPGPVWDQLCATLTRCGFPFTVGRSGCVHYAHLSFRHAIQFLGQVRPTRLLEKAGTILDGMTATFHASGDAVVAIEDAGDQWVAAIQTSTKTLIADGLLSHNCSFDAPMQGSYYGRLLAKAFQEERVGFFPYNPSFQVMSGWDLGIDDQTAIWYAQLIGDEIRLIDYYEASGEDFFHYFKHTMDQPWRNSEVWLPHDAAKTEWGTGKSAEEIAVKAFSAVGVAVRIAPKLDVNESIGVVRRLFPRMRFHDKTTGETKYRGHSATDCLASYHKKFNEERQEYENKPSHTWASHCFTGETAVLTRDGTKSIMHLPKQGEVLTLCGWKPYINPRITRRDAPLVEVRFSGGYTVRCTPDHLFLTDTGWKSAESLTNTSLIQSSLMPSLSISTVDSTDSIPARSISNEAARPSIVPSGRWHSVQSLVDAISIIVTGIRETIGSPILNVFRQASIYRSLPFTPIPSGACTLLITQEQRPQRGIAQKKDDCGIAVTPSEHNHGQNGPVSTRNAPSVERCSKLSCEQERHHNSIAVLPAAMLRITSVTPLHETADVWCLTVPDVEHFSLSNGAIVHNCADALRTLCMGIRTIRPEPTPAFYATQFDPMHDHTESQYESEFEVDPQYL